MLGCFRFLFCVAIVLGTLFKSPQAVADVWSASGQITQADRPLTNEEVAQASDVYRCEPPEENPRYCFDAIDYYQQTFIGEVTFDSRAIKVKLMTPFSINEWSHLQVNLRKDALQIAHVTSLAHHFDVQAQLASAQTRDERNLIDKNLVIFLNKHRMHSQTQRWLPTSQYHLEETDVLVEISHDGDWITWDITRYLPQTTNGG